MKRFALLLVLLLSVSVFADYATNITVIEEVVVDSPAPEVDAALDNLTEQLVAEPADDVLGGLAEQLAEPVEVVEENASEPVEAEENASAPVVEEVPLEEPVVFDESSLADELAEEAGAPVEVPAEEPVVEIVSVEESDDVAVVEEVTSAAVAPLVEDALDVMADRLVANESDEVPEEAPVEEPVEPEVPFGPTGVVVDDNVTVIEEVTSPAVAPYVEEALDEMLENLVNETSVQTEQLPVEIPSPEQLPVNISPVNVSNVTVIKPVVRAVFDAEGNAVDSEILVSGSTVTIDLKEGPVQEIVLLNVENASELPRVDVVPTDIPAPDGVWAQVYAIDPTSINFTSGIVEVVAKGTSLYKCKDWNFDARSCDGEWKLVAEDMVPGNTYLLELTPDDPGFGETINISKANHLDSNRTFISDVYDEVKSLDGVWSEPIYKDEWVRVTFSQNLSSENDITVYARNNQNLNSHIEVYYYNSTEKITQFPIVTDQGYYQVLLTNMSGSHDTFDLKIVNNDEESAYLEFDHIIDPALAELGGTFFDGFESGSLATNNWTVTPGITDEWRASTNHPYAGTYSALAKNVDSESTMSVNISTAGYRNITFSFYIQTENLGTDEYETAEWYNGTGWIVVLNKTTNALYTLASFNLTSDANNNPNFKIRFKCFNNGPNDHCHVDNVQVSGTVSNITPPNVTNASVVPTNPSVGNSVCLRVNVTDPDNVSSVIATIDRPVGVDQTVQLFDTHTCNSVPNDGIFSNLFLVTQEGVHNWTFVNATDGLNNTGQTVIGLTFTGFYVFINTTGIFYPTSAAYHNNTSLNTSLINISDNIYATQSVVSNNTFMFFNWTLGNIDVRNVTIEHNYVGSPVAKLQMFNNSVWQDVCTLNASATDVNDTCDLNVFVNSTSSVQFRINVSNVTVQTTQNVDQVFIRAERVLRDNSLLANSSSVGEGGNISINGSYTIGNGGPVGNYTIGLNDTNHNITVGSACGAGKVFQTTSLNLSGCSGCVNNGDGTVVLPDQQNVNYVVVWYLIACANSSSYSPVNLLTYKVNGSGQAVFDNATGNITIFETTPPQWSNPQRNETVVYWNSSVKFNTSWANQALAGYIFGINQSGSWVNSSFTPFSGTSNVSENVSTISASAGSVVGWYFWANDTAGNSNQTDVQNFTVQSRPTSLAFSVNQSMYPQGRSPGAGYDIYIPFEARYVDVRTSQPISGATCYVTNDETSDNITLVYNATTGNYSEDINDYVMYDVVTFNATCSKANYNASSNSTSTNVWLFMYLWEWQNMSYGAYSNYTTHWLRTEPATGSLYTLTETFNTSIGETDLPTTFFVYGSGTNGSFLKDYNMVGNQTLRLNISINDTSCQPYLCTHIVDWYLNPLTEQCGAPVSIPADTPTLIEQNVTANYSVSQNYYLALHLHFNCSSAVSEQVNVYYNYTDEPVSIEIHHARPTQIISQIIDYVQLEANYTVGPNGTSNNTAQLWIQFNNTGSEPRYTQYWLPTPILQEYPNSIANGTVYIYNSTGQLWASDNASAGAPNVATVHSDNRIEWSTEIIPNMTAIVETGWGLVRDAEYLVNNTAVEKSWNISVWSIYTPQIITENVSVWTNYSSYGAGDDWDFNVTKTVNGNTTDITSQVIVNTSAKTLAMPMTDLSGVVYVVAAKDKRPPAVFDLRPVAGTNYNVSMTINVSANVTDNVAVDTVLANITYPNSTTTLLTLIKTVGTDKYNNTFLIPNLTGQYNVTFIANDSAGNVNRTETTFFVGVDGTLPSVFDLRPVAGTNYNISTTINISANVTDNVAVDAVKANITYPNSTIVQLILTKDGATDKYNNTFTIPNLTGRYNVTFIANDTAGNVNRTETTFFVGTDSIPPTITPIGCVPLQVNINGSTTCNATITDNVGISIVLANVTLPNNTVVPASVTNVSSNYSFTFNTTPLTGRYNVTWFANDTSGNNATANDSFSVGNPPSVIIIAPHGETFDENYNVIVSVNATDPYGIDSAIAQVTFNGTSENITLGSGQQSDNFESDTINTSWFVENISIGANQTCIANINTTVPGKAYTAINGTGNLPDTLCSIISNKRIDGDFDVSISFDILNSLELDSAANFGFTDKQSSANSARQLFIGITNFAGYGQQYQIYADDGNFSGYVLLRDTNDTSGRMRIKRIGSNFTFYTWNGSWVEENVSQNTFDFNRALFVYFEAESSHSNYGALNVSWDNFTVQADNFSFNSFDNTSVAGLYNVTIVVNNTLGLVNDSEKTNFSIAPVNEPPSTPWIFWPAPNAVLAGKQYVTWSQVYDEESNSLQFNVTLLNPDYSFNASIVSNYGNSTSTQYVWNTSNYPDGVYSLRVTVFENETAEHLSNSDYVVGNFTIDNTWPSVEFVPPTPANGSAVSGIQILNVSAVDPLLLQVVIYNSSSIVLECNSSPCTYTWNTSLYPEGPAIFYATASDYDNTNRTDNLTLIVDRTPPSVFDLRPVENTSYAVSTVINISANVTDSVGVDVVLANVTYPNSTIVQLTLTKDGATDKYNNTFTIPNLLGQYNVTFIANDTAGNNNNTETTYFVAGGAPIIATSKSGLPNPVQPGATLSYHILVNNTGDDTAFNITVLELYPANVTFNGSSPVPSSGNDTWNLGNLSPGNAATINITVNVSLTAPTGSILNNTYNVTFANSSGQNTTVTNSTLTVVGNDTIPPSVAIMSPLPNSTFLLNESVNITSNVTDNVGVDVVLVQITYPDGNNETFTTSVSGGFYNLTFTNLTLRGNYTVRIIANDTLDNINDTETIVFTRVGMHIIDLINSAGQFWNYSVTVTGNDSGMLNFTIDINDSRVHVINMTLHDEDNAYSVIRIDDDVPYNESAYFAEYSIDTSGINYTSMTVLVTVAGDNVLYICKDYNYSGEECINSNWTAFMNLTIGQNYTFMLTPGDPGFLETSSAVDVAVVPVNYTAFVIAFIDANLGRVQFKVMNTNGSTIVNAVDVDTLGIDNTSRVDVSMLNSSHFVISWAKGPSNNLSYEIFRVNGSNASAPFNLGSIGLNKDVGLGEIGSRYALCYANDTSNGAEFQMFLNNGSQAVGLSSIDANIAPGATLQNLVDCAGINGTRWAYFYFDDQTNDAKFAILNETGGINASATIDAAVGETAQVAVESMNNDRFGMVWYDSATQNITIAIRTSNNVVVLAPTEVENVGTVSRVAAGTVRRNVTSTEDLFVFAWYNNVSNTIRAAVYNSTGSQVTAPFTVDTQPGATFRLLDVASRDPITTNTLCPGRFVVAYSNSTDQGIFKGFLVNGSSWDGTCDLAAPSIILNYPPAGLNTSSTTINFNWTATNGIDPVLMCNLTIDGVVNASNIASPNGTAVNYTVSGFVDGTHYWNVTCVDDSGNVNSSETRNFTVDTVKPAVQLNYPPNGANLSNSTINFNWTATNGIDTSLDCNLTIDGVVNASNIASPNGTPTNYTVSGFTDGVHLWNVTCRDDSGNVNTSETRNFTVDTVGPNITLNYPPPGFNTTNTSVDFNWTVTDNVDPVLTCNLTIDGVVNVSDIPSPNGTPVNYTVTGFSIGNHTWNVTCWDDALNVNTSETRNFTVNTTDLPPSVFILSPPPGSTFLLNESVNITSNVTDDFGVDTVLFQITYPDGSNGTYVPSVSGTLYNLTFLNLTLRGNYTVRVFANDTVGQINNTETVTFRRVSYQIIDVINSTDQFWNYSVSVTGNDSGMLNITIDINGSRVRAMNVTVYSEDSVYSIIRLDDDVSYDNSAYFDEYSIDTSGINYTNMTVLVTSAADLMLHICKNYNFSEQECIEGNWSELMNLTIGQNYTFLLTPGDPGYLETSSAVDVAVVPINYTAFVIAYIDAALNRAAFRIMNTNGSVINTTIVDTSVDNVSSRIDVEMINATNFVVVWAKGPSNNLTMQFFDINGVNTSSQIQLGGSLGLNKDVAIGELGDRFAVCYVNDSSNNAAFQEFYNNGTPAVGLSNVDANIAPGATLQNLVDCVGINNTRWSYFFFDDQTNDAKFAILNEAGAITASATIDATVGETGQVAVESMNNDRFGMVWYDSTDRDITIAIRTRDNAVVLAPTDVDTDAGLISRVAAGTVRLNQMTTEDLFVFAWYNNVSNTIRAAVYNSTGSQVTAPFTVDTQPGATFRLLDVASRDTITNDTLCPGRFVVAYSNSTDQGVFKGFLVNGSPWNGVCDLEAPSIVLNYPPAGFNTSNNTINFNWTATNGIDPVLSCNLTVDGVVNASNIASPNGTAVNYTVSGFNDGTHYWNVTCVDDSGNTNTSETRNFTVDTQKPSVQLNYPPQGFNTSNTTINFNWTANNGIDTSLDCNLTIDGAVNASNIASPNGTAVNYTVSGFADGTHSWNVTCKDDSGNVNVSETRNFTVDTVKPGVVLNYPPAGFNTSNTTIDFNWTASNGVDPVLECNLTIDGVVNASNIASPNGTATNYTVSGFVDGLHLWNVSCVDDSGNVNTSETRNFTVDTSGLNIALNFPPDGFSTTSTMIDFNWTATDNIDVNLTCNLTIDGVINVSNVSSPNGTPTNYTVAGFSLGAHLWNVTCWDSGNNTTASETRSFTITAVPPTPSGGGGSGGRGYVPPVLSVEKPGCIDGRSIIVGATVYGPTCCSDAFCKSLGEKWSCETVDDFNICVLPEGAEMPKQVVAEERPVLPLEDRSGIIKEKIVATLQRNAINITGLLGVLAIIALVVIGILMGIRKK